MPSFIKQPLYRIALAGDSGVGKSSYVACITKRRISKVAHGTIGVDFASAVVAHKGEGIKIHIWDTAGQRNYRAIIRAYFRKTAGILLFFDVTDRQSFENLSTWLDEIDTARGEDSRTPIVIVGSKVDAFTERQVGRSEATAFAMRESCMYEEVSAVDEHNIGAPIVRLTAEMHEPSQGPSGYQSFPQDIRAQLLPKKRSRIRDICDRLSDKYCRIS